MATSGSGATNEMASTTPKDIPRDTGPKSEAHILEALRAVNARNFNTLADVALTGVSGEPLDDKTYLMERIIQLTADLPLNGRLSDTLTNSFLNQLWNDLSHPPNSYLGYDFAFRKADGCNNNVLWPHIGKAGMPYARSVRPRKMQPPRPDPGVIFDSVLARKEFVPHPNKISSVLFYLASIIIHDCFHTSHEDYAISETSSYLDLAPLYGSTEKQQRAVRTMKDGKLKPDCFSDSRILGFPPGVGVMLIMFNRFHNNAVENLARIDENGRFSRILIPDPKNRRRTGLTDSKTNRTPEQDYDEALFQTGRLITGGLYVNIVLQDYVRTILGLNRVDSLWNLDPRSDYGKALFGHTIPEAQGNQVSAEFSLVYRWHSCVSERDEKWTKEFIGKFAKKDNLITAAAEWADELIKKLPEERPFGNLKRLEDGRFSDDDLCKIWTESVEDVAGAFGAAHVPTDLKFVEVLSMMQARSWNLASLNEFREYFKLQPHKTFESINPDPHIAQQLKKLYGHPDNVEIYPGIVVESAKKPIAPGSGLCASWTTSRAILSDAVSLIRSDRFYTVDYSPTNLTNWGFKTASSDLNINHGSVFYKLVLNAFPNNLSKNSIYAHFPLVNPPENKVILQGMQRAQLYDFDRPLARPSPQDVKPSADLASKALTDSSNFTSLWTSRSAAFGAPEAAKVKPATKLSFAEAVMANDKWKAITSKFYTETLQNLWQEKQFELGGYQTIDGVADVLNAAHTSFITSVLGIPLSRDSKDEEPHSLLDIFGHLFEHAFGVNPQPSGLSTTVRDWTHWIAGAIEHTLSAGSDATSKEGELGQAAFAKLKQANGPNATELAWRDILPTSALILTTLSRSSASVMEQAVPPPKQAQVAALGGAAAAKLSNTTVAVRATTASNEAQKGQVIIVDLSNAHSEGDIKKLGPEVVLAQQVAEVANKTILGIIEKIKGIERFPGPQGVIKKVKIGGDVRYLNETESDYVTYPVSMKIEVEEVSKCQGCAVLPFLLER